MIIGIDVGNSDVKSVRTQTPSGFLKHGKLPFGCDCWIKYYGDFYVPTNERFPYRQNKTQDDDCLILSLFAIAKEIIARLKEDGIRSPEDLQAAIDKIEIIDLGVGLPPAHFATLRDQMTIYYKDRMERGISFSYNSYQFHLKTGGVFCFPQDYVAAVTHKGNNISEKFQNYVAVDIGGYTVDVVQINNKKPEGRQKSMPMGIFRFYDMVIDTCMNETGLTLTKTNIETVLRQQPNVIPKNCLTVIHEQAERWVEDIINKLSEAGYELRTMPCLFIGGGAQLLKPYIEKNKLLSYFDFINDIHANAIGYEKYVGLMLRSRKAG